MKPPLTVALVLGLGIAALPGCLYVRADGETLRELAEDRTEEHEDLQRDVRDLRRRIIALERKAGIASPGKKPEKDRRAEKSGKNEKDGDKRDT